MLLPDIRGMHPYYTDLALAFSTAGIHTGPTDPCGRTAGVTVREAFELVPHAKALTSELPVMTHGAGCSVLSTGTAQDRPLPGRHGRPAAGLGSILSAGLTRRDDVPMTTIDMTDPALPGVFLAR